MAKAGRQISKKRVRRPRRQLRFTLEEVYPKEQADALRRWLAAEKARVSAARVSAAELEQGRREIDRYLAIRDNQIRPPWMNASLLKSSLKKKRRKKHAGGRQREWDYAGIENLAKNYIKTHKHNLPPTKALLYEKVADACKFTGIYARPAATQFQAIVDGVYRRYKTKGKSRKLVSDKTRKNYPSHREK
jgi:hypothetical protein